MAGKLCADVRGWALTGVRLAVRGRTSYLGEQRGEPRVQGERPRDFLYSVDNCGMIAMSQQEADLLESQPGVLSE